MIWMVLGIIVLTSVIVSIIGGLLVAWVEDQPWATRLSPTLIGVAFGAVLSVTFFVALNPDPPVEEEQGRLRIADVLPLAALSSLFWVPGLLTVGGMLRRRETE